MESFSSLEVVSSLENRSFSFSGPTKTNKQMTATTKTIESKRKILPPLQ